MWKTQATTITREVFLEDDSTERLKRCCVKISSNGDIELTIRDSNGNTIKYNQPKEFFKELRDLLVEVVYNIENFEEEVE